MRSPAAASTLADDAFTSTAARTGPRRAGRPALDGRRHARRASDRRTTVRFALAPRRPAGRPVRRREPAGSRRSRSAATRRRRCPAGSWSRRLPLTGAAARPAGRRAGRHPDLGGDDPMTALQPRDGGRRPRRGAGRASERALASRRPAADRRGCRRRGRPARPAAPAESRRRRPRSRRPSDAPRSAGSPTSAASSRPAPGPRPTPRPRRCAPPSGPTTRTSGGRDGGLAAPTRGPIHDAKEAAQGGFRAAVAAATTADAARGRGARLADRDQPDQHRGPRRGRDARRASTPRRPRSVAHARAARPRGRRGPDRRRERRRGVPRRPDRRRRLRRASRAPTAAPPAARVGPGAARASPMPRLDEDETLGIALEAGGAPRIFRLLRGDRAAMTTRRGQPGRRRSPTRVDAGSSC